MVAEIYQFTGSTCVDLPPNKVINYAKDLEECVIVGLDADDRIYVAGSSAKVCNVVYLLELGKLHMLRLGDEV